MTAMSEAVDALTRRWTDIVTVIESGDRRYIPVDHAPLLDMLHDLIRSNIGERSSGGTAANERNLIDLNAFTLWETIDGAARASWRDLSKSRPSEDLKDLVRELAGLLTAQRASGQVNDVTFVRMTAQFPKWREQIWNLFDPPTVKELIGACPHCEERFVYAPDGSRGSALIVYYVRSEQPEAKCQRCGEVWVGAKQLLTLGFHLGATVDGEALKQMGIDAA
jgi:hypothetical protein